MSRLARAEADAPAVGRGPRATVRPVWDAPLAAHLAALGVVLLLLLAVVGPSSSFSADEGAAILQARSLSRGHGWVVAHPVPEADALGRNYPLELSERGAKGFAPFGKHPLYALLLAGADRAGGVAAMVLLSLAGTVAAAGLAAALARRADPVLGRPTLWVVGLASPLLFDGFLVVAHTLGAALAVGAVLVAVVAVERRSPVVALAVLPLLATDVLLRNEALFLAFGLGVAAALLVARRAEARWPAGVLALGAPAAAVTAHVAERLWTSHLLGGRAAWSGVGAPAPGSNGLVAGRARAFLLTWLTPGYGPPSPTLVALLAMLTVVAIGALAVRYRRPAAEATTKACSVVAAAAAVVALAAGPATIVPGLLVAFPLAGAGLILVRRETLRASATHVGFGVFVVFALAVIATQYTRGGSGEWGGRYFAIGLPCLVPALLLALRDAGRTLGLRARRQAVACLTTCSLAVATIGVVALRSSHQNTARLVASFDRAGAAAGGDRPVLVTTEGSAPRFAWATFDRQRWLLTDPSGLQDLLARLRRQGIGRVAFVTRDFSQDHPLLGPGVTVVSTDDTAGDRGWHVLVLELA